MIKNALLIMSLLAGLTVMAQANDTIVLESTFTGDREQPAVSFFIPWQEPSGPESLFINVQSQIFFDLNEADKKEMSRLYTYYSTLDETADAAGTSSQ